MLHRGICPDFAALAADRIRFAVLAATAGAGDIAPHFYENLASARDAGIAVAVYHDLRAGDLDGAAAEADHFLRVLAALEDPPLWAMCRVESPALPRDARTLSNMVRLFLTKVRGAGFSPMLYTTDDRLRHGLSPMGQYDLCLALWSVPEARAMVRNPRIWEYGEGTAGDIPRAVLLRGYFPIPVGNPAGIF